VKNEFTSLLFNSCSDYLSSRENTSFLREIRDPVWSYLIQHCASFVPRDCNACFSQIFEEQTFGYLNEEEKLFITLRNFESFCVTCENNVSLNSRIFLTVVTANGLNQSGLIKDLWPTYVTAIHTRPGRLTCVECDTITDEPILRSVSHSTFLFIEFSPNLMIDFSMFETVDIGRAQYKLKGVVRCHNNHFTCAVKLNGKWTYFDDLCANVREFPSLTMLQHVYQFGWFFTIYEQSASTESAVERNETMHTASGIHLTKRKSAVNDKLNIKNVKYNAEQPLRHFDCKIHMKTSSTTDSVPEKNTDMPPVDNTCKNSMHRQSQNSQVKASAGFDSIDSFEHEKSGTECKIQMKTTSTSQFLAKQNSDMPSVENMYKNDLHFQSDNSQSKLSAGFNTIDSFQQENRASSSTDAKGSDCHVTPLQKQKCTRNETLINTSSTVQFLTKQTSDMSFNTCKHDILLHSEKLYNNPCTDVPEHDSLQLENSTSTNDPHSSATVYIQKGKKINVLTLALQ